MSALPFGITGGATPWRVRVRQFLHDLLFAISGQPDEWETHHGQ